MYFFRTLISFRTYQKLAYDKASAAEKNKVQSSDGMQTEYHLSKKEIYEAYKHEFQIWVRVILTKLNEMTSRQENIEITNKFPFLHEVLKNTLRPISKFLGSKKDLVS